MSWLNGFIYDLITAKGRRTSDYQYDILEHTPYLHGTETLNQMYKNAKTDDQKAAIMLHIERFYEYTHDVDSYRELRNKIWDDFRD